ncbi:MAG: hypothetical protein GF383_01090 [Candidatus Lokiarchaeota archaeon]|nr:hypothetical protein [Candidatus Lokiarchaeota archaeon]MBD3337836.1 hypothetical protein [Candidatus Lokiarchaeota archaeon]
MKDIFAELETSNKPIIGCIPLYPPLELFHSMGFIPIVLWGLKNFVHNLDESDKHLQDYTCSIARYLMQFVLEKNHTLFDGVFTYNACDTLRNIPELIKSGLIKNDAVIPMYKIHIPMTIYDEEYVANYIKYEIVNLINQLELDFGARYSDKKFIESVDLFRNMRKRFSILEDLVKRNLLNFSEYVKTVHQNYFLPVEKQLEVVDDIINNTKKETINIDESNSKNESVNIILSGILPPPISILEFIESLNMNIIGNDIASLTRFNAFTPDQSTFNNAPEYYIRFYRKHFPCTTLLFTSKRRIQKVIDLALESSAKGLIFIGEKFCEYENFEIPHLKKALTEHGIKVLALEFSIDDEKNIESFNTRIEAFYELLKKS